MHPSTPSPNSFILSRPAPSRNRRTSAPGPLPTFLPTPGTSFLPGFPTPAADATFVPPPPPHQRPAPNLLTTAEVNTINYIESRARSESRTAQVYVGYDTARTLFVASVIERDGRVGANPLYPYMLGHTREQALGALMLEVEKRMAWKLGVHLRDGSGRKRKREEDDDGTEDRNEGRNGNGEVNRRGAGGPDAGEGHQDGHNNPVVNNKSNEIVLDSDADKDTSNNGEEDAEHDTFMPHADEVGDQSEENRGSWTADSLAFRPA